MVDKGPLLLRDFLIWRFDTLEKEFRSIRVILEEMAEKPVSGREFENIKLQVAGLAEGLKELEDRTAALEKHKSLASWLFGQLVSFGVIVVIIYLLEVIR
jgi:hypothetical protein